MCDGAIHQKDGSTRIFIMKKSIYFVLLNVTEIAVHTDFLFHSVSQEQCLYWFTYSFS